MALKGGEVGSISRLRSNLKKGGGGGYLKRIPEDGSIVGRFLTEPDGWVMFYEHYDSVRKYYPCSDDCPGCDEGDNPSQRYLANFLDVDDNKVIPLLMPKTLASSILKKFDKFKTLLDRDYELSRTGSGRDVEYEAIPESPSKMNVNRYELLDLWKLVEDQLPSDGDDDEDDDEEEARPSRPHREGASTRRKTSSSAPARRRRVADDDDDEDERPARRRTSGTAKRSMSKSKPGSAKRRTMSRR